MPRSPPLRFRSQRSPGQGRPSEPRKTPRILSGRARACDRGLVWCGVSSCYCLLLPPPPVLVKGQESLVHPQPAEPYPLGKSHRIPNIYTARPHDSEAPRHSSFPFLPRLSHRVVSPALVAGEFGGCCNARRRLLCRIPFSRVVTGLVV